MDIHRRGECHFISYSRQRWVEMVQEVTVIHVPIGWGQRLPPQLIYVRKKI